MHIEGRCQFCPDRRTPLHATAAENATSVTIRHGRNRRLALCLLLAAMVVPAAVFAQSPAIPRIGFLGPGLLVEEFRKAIADLGYVEGRSVVIDVQWPDGDRLDLMTASANELLQRKADVLVVVGATAARAAKSATTTVPIVFEVVVDPVATGLVAALDKPGGNATGSTTFDPGFSTRQIELLRSVLPET